MTTLLNARGLPLLSGSGIDLIGPGTGKGFRVRITEHTEVTFPNARMLRMLPGEYVILTAEDFDAMTGTGIAPAPGAIS